MQKKTEKQKKAKMQQKKAEIFLARGKVLGGIVI